MSKVTLPKSTKGSPPRLESTPVSNVNQADPDAMTQINMQVRKSWKNEVHTFAIDGGLGSITNLFKVAFEEYRANHPLP